MLSDADALRADALAPSAFNAVGRGGRFGEGTLCLAARYLCGKVFVVCRKYLGNGYVFGTNVGTVATSRAGHLPHLTDYLSHARRCLKFSLA